MKQLCSVILVAAIAGWVAAAAIADDAAVVKEQTNCPVMGGPIDKQHYADYDGKRVYFCCPMCVKPFNEDPEKYIKKLEDEGITLAKTPVPQTTCPVSGEPIDKQYFADHDGKRVYFCGPGCVKSFDEDPAKYIKKLEDEGITLAKAPVPQTTCPKTGRAIDKDYYADYNGKRVYFCGPGCLAAFKADPEPYMQKLATDNVALEDAPKEIKTQTMCAVMTNREINKNMYVDYDGKRIYFCCGRCPRAFRRDPDKYIKRLEDAGITLEKAPDADD